MCVMSSELTSWLVQDVAGTHGVSPAAVCPSLLLPCPPLPDFSSTGREVRSSGGAHPLLVHSYGAKGLSITAHFFSSALNFGDVW